MEGTPHTDLALTLDASVSATKNLINRARMTLLESERARTLADPGRQAVAA